jgi:hypothetical protein
LFGPLGLILCSLLTLLLLPTTTTGCATGSEPSAQTAREAQLTQHAYVLLGLQSALSATRRIIEKREWTEYRAIEASAVPLAQQADQKAKLEATYRPVDAAYALTAEAYDAYRDALMRAHDKGTELSTELAASLLSRWRAMVDAAELIGLDVPKVPGFLEGVADGV